LFIYTESSEEWTDYLIYLSISGRQSKFDYHHQRRMMEEGPACLQELRNTLCTAGCRVMWRRNSIGFEVEEASLGGMMRGVVLGDAETGKKRSNSVIVYGPPGSGKSTVRMSWSLDPSYLKQARNLMKEEWRISKNFTILIFSEFFLAYRKHSSAVVGRH
jgi:hypothetical protein